MKIIRFLLYSKAASFIGLFLYRFVLDYSFINIIFPQWGYQGFILNFNQSHIVISWLFLILLSPLIIKTFRTNNISSNIMTVLVLTSLVPTTSLFAHSNYKFEYIYLNSIYWTLLLLLNILIPTLIWKSVKEKTNNLLKNIIIIILSATIISISFIYTGFRFHFGFFDVYDMRVEARAYNLLPIFSYLNSAANTILPIIFIYYIIRNKKALAIIIGVIIFLNFGIAGGKSVVLSLGIALIGYFFIKSLIQSRFFVWGFILLVISAITEFNVFTTIYLSFFTIYRTLFLTSYIGTWYYDFFSTREFDYFRQSILKWSGIESPYKDNLAFLISYTEMDSDGRANNGLFSDAYTNLGPVGMIIFPIILVLILKVIERSTKGLDERLLFIITVVTSMNLISLPFSTALLSGGLFLMIIFLHSIPRNKKITDIY